LEHFSRKCCDSSKDFLKTEHFVHIYKDNLNDILDQIKNTSQLIGDKVNISVIEIKTVKGFLDSLVTNKHVSDQKNITLVYDGRKISKEDLKEAIENIESYKVFETSKISDPCCK